MKKAIRHHLRMDHKQAPASFFFSSRRRHTRWSCDWSSDVCSSDLEKKPASAPLAGFNPAQPVVFCGLFPVDASEFENLREAVGKLRLNDARDRKSVV